MLFSPPQIWTGDLGIVRALGPKYDFHGVLGAALEFVRGFVEEASHAAGSPPTCTFPEGKCVLDAHGHRRLAAKWKLLADDYDVCTVSCKIAVGPYHLWMYLLGDEGLCQKPAGEFCMPGDREWSALDVEPRIMVMPADGGLSFSEEKFLAAQDLIRRHLPAGMVLEVESPMLRARFPWNAFRVSGPFDRGARFLRIERKEYVSLSEVEEAMAALEDDENFPEEE